MWPKWGWTVQIETNIITKRKFKVLVHIWDKTNN